LSLGRYHLLPPGRPGTRVRLHRRHSGGRATAFGDGFVGLALTLPHRSALVSAEPLALAPDQVMNRCVRGILEGLKAAGVAAFVRRSYEEVFGLTLEAGEAPAPAPIDEDRWLRQRAPRPELDRQARTRTQLGCLEAHFMLDGVRIADLALAGDFIANSPAIEQLERELRGCRAERRMLDDVVTRVFARPEDFILGVGPLETIAATIMRGVPT